MSPASTSTLNIKSEESDNTSENSQSVSSTAESPPLETTAEWFIRTFSSDRIMEEIPALTHETTVSPCLVDIPEDIQLLLREYADTGTHCA